MEDDYFIENEYIYENDFIFEKPNYHSFTPETNHSSKDILAIKPMIDYEENNRNNSQYITYLDHPNIIIEKEKEEEEEKEKETNDLNILSQIYFGSITIIGLYIFFKLLQRSK